MFERLRAVVVNLGWILWESVYFYFEIFRSMIMERLIFSGLLLLLLSPYILTVNAIMRFIPKEHEDKVLPFVYTMQ